MALDSAPFSVSENSQFLRLCSIEHNRKNRVNIDSINGANASAITYTIVEAALANHINVYDYFEYLFSKMPEHLDDSDRSFITDLLHWSPEVVNHCKRQS